MVQLSAVGWASTGSKMKLAKGSPAVARYPVSPASRTVVRLWLLALIMAGCHAVRAQTPATENDTATPVPQPQAQPPIFSPPPVDIKSLPKNLFVDQKNFWLSPLHMTQKQWEWAVPLVLAGGALVIGDNTIEKHVPTSSTTVSHAVTASNAGVGVLVGAGGAMFLLGHMQKNDQKRETG